MSSYGLACALFLLLLLLTYLGTLYQVEHGVYAAQEKYFESFVFAQPVGDWISIPLPGGYLLLVILFANILLGGILRIRKGWRQAGVMVAHAGILLLLAGGAITHHYSQSGRINLYEGESTDIFESDSEWELVIGTSESVYDPTTVALGAPHLGPLPRKSMDLPGLPFDLALMDADLAADAILSIRLDVRKENGQEESLNLQESEGPAELEAAGTTWQIALRKRQWRLPFTLALDRFQREVHPGTDLPRAFTSEVSKSEGQITQAVRIEMNQPLRHKGYTVYQASWGPQDAPPGTPLYSSFAVTRNPADRFPLYACIVITVGMLTHFVLKLQRHLRRAPRAGR
jgi:hypothetical protein